MFTSKERCFNLGPASRWLRHLMENLCRIPRPLAAGSLTVSRRTEHFGAYNVIRRGYFFKYNLLYRIVQQFNPTSPVTRGGNAGQAFALPLRGMKAKVKYHTLAGPWNLWIKIAAQW